MCVICLCAVVTQFSGRTIQHCLHVLLQRIHLFSQLTQHWIKRRLHEELVVVNLQVTHHVCVKQVELKEGKRRTIFFTLYRYIEM